MGPGSHQGSLEGLERNLKSVTLKGKCQIACHFNILGWNAAVETNLRNRSWPPRITFAKIGIRFASVFCRWFHNPPGPTVARERVLGLSLLCPLIARTKDLDRGTQGRVPCGRCPSSLAVFIQHKSGPWVRHCCPVRAKIDRSPALMKSDDEQ